MVKAVLSVIYLLSYHGPTLPRTQHSDVVFNYSDSGVGLFYVDTVDLYQEEKIDAIGYHISLIVMLSYSFLLSLVLGERKLGEGDNTDIS